MLVDLVRGLVPSAGDVPVRVKEQFDTDRRLNPGRFVTDVEQPVAAA